MFRIAFESVTRPALVRRPHRTFVSSVLLSRTWENESVVDLRKEAKQRGLSLKGNKSTLILRIKEYEQHQVLEAVNPRDPPVPTGARNASTGVSPGIPPASQPDAKIPKQLTNIYLPDVSQPDPVPPVLIPFVPDFWESSRTKAAAATNQEEPILPKLLIVAGAGTHHGGGPTHNLLDTTESTHTDMHLEISSKTQPQATTKSAGSLWSDVAQDIGISSSFDVREANAVVADSLPKTSSDGTVKPVSRALDKEQSRGLWVILGLMGGTWLLGSFFNSASSEKKSDEPASSH